MHCAASRQGSGPGAGEEDDELHDEDDDALFPDSDGHHAARRTKQVPDWANPQQQEVAPEYAHLPSEIGNHLTTLKVSRQGSLTSVSQRVFWMNYR